MKKKERGDGKNHRSLKFASRDHTWPVTHTTPYATMPASVSNYGDMLATIPNTTDMLITVLNTTNTPATAINTTITLATIPNHSNTLNSIATIPPHLLLVFLSIVVPPSPFGLEHASPTKANKLIIPLEGGSLWPEWID
jgi:hypothetical protein